MCVCGVGDFQPQNQTRWRRRRRRKKKKMMKKMKKKKKKKKSRRKSIWLSTSPPRFPGRVEKCRVGIDYNGKT